MFLTGMESRDGSRVDYRRPERGARRKGRREREQSHRAVAALRLPWDADHLYFTVREPFPTKTTGASLVFGRVSVEKPLLIESHMPERGVIFSDGIEADFVEFNSGSRVEITVAERKGVLVV